MPPFDCLDPSTPLLGHHLLEASAGTGKTFAVEHIVARLLLHHFPIDQILIITFTRAAARELRARLRQNLSSLLRGSPIPYIDPAKTPLFRLEEALLSLDRASISTIHGFCARMLRECGAKMGEEHPDAISHPKERVADFLRTSLPKEAFSASQLAALLKRGIDKEIDAIATLVSTGGEIPLYPDFSTSYATFKEALARSPQISLKRYLTAAPLFKRTRIDHPRDQIAILSQPPTEGGFDRLLHYKGNILSNFTRENLKRQTGSTPPIAEEFLSANAELSPIVECAKNPFHTRLRIAQSYRNLGVSTPLSPDGILQKMYEETEHPPFLSQVRARYRALIVDEFQDTDPLQWAILQRLFIDEPIPALYLIGDPKQSLYSFRNADIGTYRKASRSIPQTLHLDTNYRSEPRLLTLLNRLFSQNPHWISEREFPLPYRPVQPSKTATDTPLPGGKSPLHFLIADRKRGEKSLSALESKIFFPFLTREIRLLTERGVPLKDIALLVKDRHQKAHLAAHLKREGIPTATRGALPIAETPSYDFLRTLLHAIAHPSRESAIRKLLSHTLLPYTHNDLSNPSLIAEGKAACAHFAQLFQTEGLPRMLDALLHYAWPPAHSPRTKSASLEPHLPKGNGQKEVKFLALTDFRTCVELLFKRASQTKLSLASLSHHFDSLSSGEGGESLPPNPSNAIELMTIHASKGLEFPIVFVPGLIKRHAIPDACIHYEGKWLPPSHPLCKTALQKREAEKLRQLYVALTRAKQRLYIPALIDPTRPPLSEETSPLELFLSKIPPLKITLAAIGATYTELG